MISLRCLSCGLAVPYRGSQGEICPRCLARSGRAVQLIAVSDRPSSTHTMGRLTMTTSGRGEQRTIGLRGELDVASAPILEATIEEMCSEGCKEIVIDLAGVEFIDSSGLNAILRAKSMCEDHGCEYALNPAQRPAQRVFEMTRVVDRLRFRPTAGRRGDH